MPDATINFELSPRRGCDIDRRHSTTILPTRALALSAALALAGCSTFSAPKPTLEGAAPPDTAANPADSGKTGAASSAPSAPAEGMMEKTRESVRSTTLWLARGVDSWFGDRPFEEGAQVTDGRLSVGALRREAEGSSVNVRFNARFRLPNLERRAYAFIGRDNQREVVADTPGALTRQQRLLEDRPENQSFFAGLGLPFTDVFDFRLGFRGGLKPYAQARYRKPWDLSARDSIEFRQTVFWILTERFGSTTALSYEHGISPVLAFRWVNAATITQKSKNYEWSSVAGTYRNFGEQRLLSLEAVISGRPGTGVDVSDYGLQARWEQPVHKDWLLGEFTVGHFWPQKDALSERVASWAFGAAVKMRF